MTNTLDKVLAIAKAEVGYLEKKTNAQLDSKTANAGQNNFTKYWRDMKANGYQGASWCNCFVNWCFVKAYGESNAKRLLCTAGIWSYYTPTSSSYFKAKNQWFKSPKSGDIIYFQKNGEICHVGIVYAVDSSYVYTYEGNTSGGSTVVANGGGVAAKKYTLGYDRIAGYGRPAYDVPDTTNAKTTKACHIWSYMNTWDDDVCKIAEGTKIEITKDHGNGWSEVKYGSKKGFIKNSVVKMNKEELSGFPTRKTTEDVALRNGRVVDKTTFVKQVDEGTKFTLLAKDDKWVYGQFGDKKYYLVKSKTNVN